MINLVGFEHKPVASPIQLIASRKINLSTFENFSLYNSTAFFFSNLNLNINFKIFVLIMQFMDSVLLRYI